MASGSFIFRIARAIAGTARAEWVEAMEAEAQYAGGSSTWALGCLWASVKDRFAREWRFVLAVVAVPIGAYLLQLALFYPLAWLLRQQWIAGWILVGSGLLAPLPFAFLLGRMRPGLPAYLALLISFPVAVFFPLTLFWIEFGKSPFSWFSDDATWYMMPPIAGLTCALLVWVAGAWVGSRWRRNSG